MVKNFMVSAFGINASESSEPITEIFTTSENKNVYKLDVSDPLKYKWSLFIKNDADTPTPTGSNPITTNISDSVFALKLRLIIIITVIVVVIIGVTIFSFYKIKQYRSKLINQL
ncbi:unnamed protein product [Rhizophagus irregularis]|nr:unnamed protein product [Rhizophagus irregularis]